MQFQKLSFKNSTGESLGARLDLPVDGEPVAYAVFAHCFTCSKNLNAVNHISRALTQKGIAVMRFDFTGIGESEGDFANTNFSSNVADLVAAADYLQASFAAPKILIGHSFGGAAVLQAAAQIPSSRAVATISAPADPAHVAHLLQSAKKTIEAEGKAEVVLAGRKFTIKKQFLDDLERPHMEETIGNLKRALLLFHSPVDNIVSIENAAAIFQSAKHPKSFVSLDQADHLLTNENDALYVGSVLAAWAQKYIAVTQPEAQQGEPADNHVVVRTGKTKYRTEIKANGHSLIADEPTTVGGGNTGPTPYDYLVAALGACTTITLRMYADRKEWPLEAIVARLAHQKIHAEDCEACQTKGNVKLDQIEREIELIGQLDEEQRQRLLQIANKCPVHRTLHSEIVVNTRLAE
jgi:putative redox protein